MPALARSEWYDLTRDMNWTLSYVDQEQAWPQELSNTYGIPVVAEYSVRAGHQGASGLQ